MKSKILTIGLLFLAGLDVTAQQPNPAEFAVPEAAFQQVRIHQLAGGLSVKSGSFSGWLNRTGKFGELVSLSDKRDLKFASGTGALPKIQRGKRSSISRIPNNRVCDIAYQIICKKYRVEPLSYRYGIEERDKLISALLLKIKRPEEDGSETGTPNANENSKNGPPDNNAMHTEPPAPLFLEAKITPASR